MPAIADKSKRLVIRLARYGCTNRPFYHIVVLRNRRPRNFYPPVAQLGTYDDMPNKFNEKLVSVDFNELSRFLAKGAVMSKTVAELLGLSGFLPVHPYSLLTARRNSAKQSLAHKALLEKQKLEANSDSTETFEHSDAKS